MRHAAQRINPRTPPLATILMARSRPPTPHSRDSTPDSDIHSRSLDIPICSWSSPQTPLQDYGSVTLPAFRPASPTSIQLPSLNQVLHNSPAHSLSPLPLPVNSLGTSTTPVAIRQVQPLPSETASSPVSSQSSYPPQYVIYSHTF